MYVCVERAPSPAKASSPSQELRVKIKGRESKSKAAGEGARATLAQQVLHFFFADYFYSQLFGLIQF